MPDAFFAKDKTRKRKRPSAPTNAGPSTKKLKRKGSKPNGTTATKKRISQDDGESSESSEEGGIDDLDLRASEGEESSGDEDENETPAEKRLRLAKLYLDGLKKDLADGEFDAADIDKEIISSRLKQDVLEHSGKVHLFVADLYFPSQPVIRTLDLKKGHRLPLTSLAVSETGNSVWTSGKEATIVKWDLRTGKRVKTVYKARKDQQSQRGHTDEILALAISGDEKYVVSAGRDRKIMVWDSDSMSYIQEFGGSFGHRDHISSLSFRLTSNQLYTASFDRTIKLYDLSPSIMGYVETLFGHQDSILALDSLRGETCVSAGGRDKTVRYWKITDETQLVFRGGGKTKEKDESGKKSKPVEQGPGADFVEGSLECVAMVDEQTFLSGGDSGTISLWNTAKKKPLYSYPLAHGFETQAIQTLDDENEGEVRKPRWITSLASLRYSDLFASGSYDSTINVYKLSSSLNSFTLLHTIDHIPGVINHLRFLSPSRKDYWNDTSDEPWWTKDQADGELPPTHGALAVKGIKPIFLFAAIGQEHRLGRWLKFTTISSDGGSESGTKPKNMCRILAIFPTMLPGERT